MRFSGFGPKTPLFITCVVMALAILHHLSTRHSPVVMRASALNFSESSLWQVVSSVFGQWSESTNAGSDQPHEPGLLSKENRELILACTRGVERLGGVLSVEQFSTLDEYLNIAVEGDAPEIEVRYQEIEIETKLGDRMVLRSQPRNDFSPVDLSRRIENFKNQGRVIRDERYESRRWSPALFAELNLRHGRVARLELVYAGGVLACSEEDSSSFTQMPRAEMQCRCL